MKQKHYPALYRAANTASMKAQARHLSNIRSNSYLLISAAGFGVYGIQDSTAAVGAAIIIIASIFMSFWMIRNRDEDTWYRARAIAESVKTSSWRFMMRGDPYVNTLSEPAAKAQFRERLKQLLKEHKDLSAELAGTVAQEEQITSQMCEVRELPLEERIEFYRLHRIDEQRTWYANKSAYNQKQSKIWFPVLIISQSIAVILVLLRIAFPEWKYWPTEVFLVSASCVLAWMQVKRFRELASAYGLTAHEIGIIRDELDDADSETKFAQFVTDSESAFSREHTQWLARKDIA